MSLLERFQADTEFHSVGQFVLDESRARSKMSRYQLVRIEEFALLVVQAVVAAECSGIELEWRSPPSPEGQENKEPLPARIVRIVARESLLDTEALANLDEYLFDASLDALPYHLLGVAANALELSCLQPPTLALEGEDFVFEAHLDRELPGLFSLLMDRLAHLPVPFLYQGETLPRDPIGADPRLKLSWTSNTEIVLLRYGVIVDRKRLSLPINAVAVVDSPELKLDASFSHVVEDENYKRVVENVRGVAMEELVRLAREHQPGGSNTELLFRQLLRDLPDPAGPALENCALFPLSDRKEHCSLAQLRDEIATRGKLMVSERRYNLQLDMMVVLRSDGRVGSALTTLIGENRMVSAEGTFRERQQVEQNRKRWEANSRPTELSPGVYLCRSFVKGAHWTAEIGILGPPGAQSAIDVLYQDRLLFSESLSDAPPGSTAVINFSTAKINETWTRIDGREYRTALKSIQTELGTLFNQQSFQERSSLYPELRDYLLGLLSRNQEPPDVAKSAPLFALVGEDQPVAYTEVATWGRVALGDPVTLSSRIPSTLLPEPLLLYDEKQYDALRARLGKTRVEDLRERQQRLLQMDTQMRNPQNPEICVRAGGFLECRPLEIPGVRGQIELNFSSEKEIELTIMKFGVVIDQRTLSFTKVLGWRIVLDAEALELNEDWSGVLETSAYRSLVKDLEAFGLEMERGLLHSSKTTPPLYLKLLRAYPQPAEVYRERPLFATSKPDCYCSLAELHRELEGHGHLLRGGSGTCVAGRIVVLETKSKQIQELLDETLGNPEWRDSWEVFQQNEYRKAFLERPVEKDIRLKLRYPIRLPFPSGRGEIAMLSPSEPSEGSVLHCYFEGRLVVSLSGILPKYCVGAIESDQFTVSSDYAKVSVSKALRRELSNLCSEAALLAAQHRSSELRMRALEYFANTPDIDEEISERFAGQFTVFVQGSQKRSLAELKALDKISGYVASSFDPGVPAQGTVLRLEPAALAPVLRLLKQKLSNVEAQLRTEAGLRNALAKLPTTLLSEGFQRTFSNDQMCAELAVTDKPWAVAIDGKKQAIGSLELRGFPVAAVVMGGKPKRGRGSRAEAELSRTETSQIGEWTEALYLEWVEDLSHRQAAGKDIRIALEILNQTKREIGSDRERSRARIASLLWELPLFECADGTWVSGLSLTTRFQESQEPVILVEKRWNAPAGSLLTSEHSTEFEILRSLLGKAGLQWFEAPPLLDPNEVGDSIKRLVSWGLAPIGTVIQKLGRVMNEPIKIEDKTRKKPQEVAPEKRLMFDLRQDLTNLVGRKHMAKSNGFFKDLDYGFWVLGPPIYLDKNKEIFKVNRLHPSIRWLLSQGADPRAKKIARTLLLINWVSLVNDISDELKDEHEDAFLIQLTERMAQAFAEQKNSEDSDQTEGAG